jgi:O-methyltransferase involved in polyketide biosynthesis
VRLNVGCGPDWRTLPDGWEHADLHDHGQPWVFDLAQPPYPLAGATAIVMHHVLHMLTPDAARAALAALHDIAVPGCVLRIGERDLWAGMEAHTNGGGWLHDVVADAVEPTLDGKLLRWLTWHGTVRSLWSATSLAAAMGAAGWRGARAVGYHESKRAPHSTELDTRPWETFYVEAVA